MNDKDEKCTNKFGQKIVKRPFGRHGRIIFKQFLKKQCGRTVEGCGLDY
jgi:hypothetical protein